MGAPIADNLLAAGTAVTVWNRTASTAVPFRERGAQVALTPADAVADIILSVLPDVPQLEALLDEETVHAWGSRRARLVIMSTSSPANVRRLAERLDQHSITVLDAPMSGGDRGARDGSLSIMVGGAESDFAAIKPVLDVIGTTIRHMGAVGTGSLAKLCNQMVVASTLTALAEAFSLAARYDLNLDHLREILGGGLAASAVLDLKGDKLLLREYPLGGSAINQLKDLRYARQSAVETGARVPLLTLLEKLFTEVIDRDLGLLDHAVVQEIMRDGSTPR
jgi:2-hydroxy-3-oxopropionate reductase